MKLSTTFDIPPELPIIHISGNCAISQPTEGGGYSDVYQVKWNKKYVALKRLRIRNHAGSDTMRVCIFSRKGNFLADVLIHVSGIISRSSCLEAS